MSEGELNSEVPKPIINAPEEEAARGEVVRMHIGRMIAGIESREPLNQMFQKFQGTFDALREKVGKPLSEEDVKGIMGGFVEGYLEHQSKALQHKPLIDINESQPTWSKDDALNLLRSVKEKGIISEVGAQDIEKRFIAEPGESSSNK